MGENIMGTLTIISFFTDKGTPKTGLSPTIRIRDVDTTSLVVTDAAMTEIGDGFYKFSFTSYDEEKVYSFRADGTSTLTQADRYVFGTNENNEITQVRKIATNRWQIVSNQWIEYDDDATTALRTYNLFDESGNPSKNNVFDRVPT